MGERKEKSYATSRVRISLSLAGTFTLYSTLLYNYNYSPTSFLYEIIKVSLNEWGFCPIRKRE